MRTAQYGYIEWEKDQNILMVQFSKHWRVQNRRKSESTRMNNISNRDINDSSRNMAMALPLIDSKSFENSVIEPQKWIVSNLVGENKIILLAADTGVGKSIFAQQLAISVALGKDEIIGFNIPEPRRVLFINLEMSSHQMYDRHIKLLSKLNNSEKQFLGTNLILNDVSTGRHIFEDSWGRIEATVRENEAFDLLIVDNLYSSQTGDDETNKDAKKLLAQIISVADIHNSSILLIAHHKKHDSMHDYLEVNTIRGASTYANASDVVIQMAESSSEGGLRLLRITKNRDYSLNRNITYGLTFNADTLWFENMGKVNPNRHFGTINQLSTRNEILDNLEEEFRTKDIVALYSEEDKGTRAAHYKLDSLQNETLIKKVAHGLYRKV